MGWVHGGAWPGVAACTAGGAWPGVVARTTARTCISTTAHASSNSSSGTSNTSKQSFASSGSNTEPSGMICPAPSGGGSSSGGGKRSRLMVRCNAMSSGSSSRGPFDAFVGQAVSLEGVVTKELYIEAQNGYKALQLQVGEEAWTHVVKPAVAAAPPQTDAPNRFAARQRSKSMTVTVTGKELAFCAAGHKVRVHGRWVLHARFGAQLQVDRAEMLEVQYADGERVVCKGRCWRRSMPVVNWRGRQGVGTGRTEGRFLNALARAYPDACVRGTLTMPPRQRLAALPCACAALSTCAPAAFCGVRPGVALWLAKRSSVQASTLQARLQPAFLRTARLEPAVM
eukprot:366454-Chlamydomonas_euryale.AAC.6